MLPKHYSYIYIYIYIWWNDRFGKSDKMWKINGNVYEPKHWLWNKDEI